MIVIEIAEIGIEAMDCKVYAGTMYIIKIQHGLHGQWEKVMCVLWNN